MFEGLFKSKDSKSAEKTPTKPAHPAGAVPTPFSVAGATGAERQKLGHAANTGTVAAGHKTSPLNTLKHRLEENKKEKDIKQTGSQNYNQVIDELGNLLSALEQTIPDDKDEKSVAFKGILQMYQSLRSACTGFLNRTRIRLSQNSRNRKASVKALLSTIDGELPKLLDAAQKDQTHRATWVDVLAEARVDKVNIDGIDKSKIKDKGAGTSAVKEVGDIGFFKEEGEVATDFEDLAQKEQQKLGRDNLDLFQPVLQNFRAAQGWNGYCGDSVVEILSYCGSNLAVTSDEEKEGIMDNVKMAFRVVPGHTKKDETDLYNLIINSIKYQNLSDAMENAKIDKGQDISKRNVATTRLAALLGESGLFAESKTVDLESGGQVKRGNMMAKAAGVESKVLTDRVKSGGKTDFSSPDIQRSLICIQLIDVLAAQIDHHAGNLFFQMDASGKVTGAQAIDNDLSFGKITKLDEKVSSLEQFSDKKGNFVGGLADKELVEKILNLEPDILRYAMIDLLSKEEINSLIVRLNKMKSVFRKLQQKDPGKLIERGCWGAKTEKELRGNENNMYGLYANTYDHS